jgi:hypothetical protein
MHNIQIQLRHLTFLSTAKEGKTMGRAWILCRKMFSLTLVFNALLTIACCVGILAGFYWYYYGWNPFAPYLINGNLLWFAIAAAAINVFPSALLGRKLHTGRFLFHHYFYGFLVMVFAAIYVVIFTSVPLTTIFLVNNTAPEVNLGRFFLLGGLTLLLDDLPDVNKRLEAGLNWMKAGAHRAQKAMVAAQIVTGAASLYIFTSVVAAMSQIPEWVTVANFMLAFSLLITGVTSFIFVKRKVWDSLMVNCEENGH